MTDRDRSLSSAHDDAASDKMEQGRRQTGDPGSNAAAGNDQLCPGQRCQGWLECHQQDAGIRAYC